MWNEEPCLTSEDVYNTVLKNVRAALAANPTTKYLSVSQNDSSGKRVGCECDNCMAVYNKYGCWTGLYLEFVNRVAREIKDEYPDVMIHTFAYQYTRLVPENLVPEDNVAIQLCTIEANRRFPIEDYKEYIDPDDYEEINDFEYLLKEWGNVCDYLAVWDYVTDYGNYSISLPGFEAVKENVRMFADNNVKDLFLQGAYQSECGEFGELKGYIMAKLLWDPYMSDEEYWALIDEFLIDYYGPGGVKIREYINYMQSITVSREDDPTQGAFGRGDYLDARSAAFRPNDWQSVPEDVTADMLRNYETVDWTKYLNFYRDLDDDSILVKLVNEGKRLFVEAMEMAENDRQRTALDKSYIQIELLEAYYQYEKIKVGVSFGKDLVRNFCKANPEAFTKDEQKQLSNDLFEFTKQQIDAKYSEYNKALSDKLDKYQIYNLAESWSKAHGEVLKFVTLGDDSVWNR